MKETLQSPTPFTNVVVDRGFSEDSVGSSDSLDLPSGSTHCDGVQENSECENSECENSECEDAVCEDLNLNRWDRFVLLGGGSVFGFCLGGNCAILAIGSFEQKLIWGSLLVLALSIGVHAAIYLKARRLADRLSAQLPGN